MRGLVYKKGIVRKTDDLGRVCLPIEFRRALLIEHSHNHVEFLCFKEGILVKKADKSSFEGAIRTIDKLGRVCIPKEWRDEFKINFNEETQEGTQLEVSLIEEGILIKPLNERCCICGSELELTPIKSKYFICADCSTEINNSKS